MNNKQYAKRILVHYFKLLSEEEYPNFDDDCENEVKEVVDCIFEEINKKDEKIAQLEKRMTELERVLNNTITDVKLIMKVEKKSNGEV